MTLKVLRRFAADRSGQSLAEFALVLPVLLLLIGGIIEFGRGWSISQVVTDSAREGARSTVVADADVKPDAIQTRILNRLQAGGAGVTDLVYNCDLDTTDPATANYCSNMFTGAGVGDTVVGEWRNTGNDAIVTVVVRYKLPLVSTLMKWTNGSDGILIGSSAHMRNE
ncbi:MAG TPA: TadE/TadG family type IV pilus assembly protein [Gemmatimonadales bacterium]|nr:TadE/TadG family type IV pilus assembly protein [Gemmatimonadales bacterium]